MQAHAPRWLIRTLIGFAALLSIIGIFAVWANRQLLGTEEWTQTSTELIESPPVRETVAGYLTEQIYDHVDVSAELKSGLPTQLKPLAGPAAGALRSIVQRGVAFALERPLVQELWRTANESAHAQFVKLVENRGTVVKTPGGGAVVLDLGALVTEAGRRVGVPESALEKIPPDAAEVQVMKSSQLKAVQTAVNVLRFLAIALPLLALALYALAVYLARGRRPQTLIAIGGALIAAGVIVLIARSLIGDQVVGALAKTESVRPAAEAVWSIGTSVLVSVAGAVIFVGVPVALAGMLAGTTHTAVGLRRSMAPHLRDRPGLSFGALGVLLAILIAWGPIAATRNWVGILVIIALSLFGLQMLRRQTAAEFPHAQAGESRPLSERASAAIAAVTQMGAGARAEVHEARARRRGEGAAPQPEPRPPADGTVHGGGAAAVPAGAGAARTVPLSAAAPAQPRDDLAAQLERLATLHGSGVLTDQEFADAKRRLLEPSAR